MTKLQEAWKNKFKIIAGIWNSIFGNRKEKKIAKERQKICESNTCGFYDKLGESEEAFIKGKPACGICGCNIKFLVNSMESECSLKDINKTPLWGQSSL